jgi:hypothetical protein
LPDLLSELLVSDEANKRAVSVQAVQRAGDGIVRVAKDSGFWPILRMSISASVPCRSTCPQRGS